MDAARCGWYVNDGVLDEETQRNVVRVIGFCAPHALYLSLIEGNDFFWSYLGSCIVYIHVIEYALLSDLERMLTGSGNWLLQPFRRQIFSPLRHLFHHDLCLPCFDHRQHEATYQEQFVKAFYTSEEFRPVYQQADSLCVPHARAVLRQFRDDLTQQAVALALLRSVSQVGKRVEGYVYKCTERFQDQINRTNESLGLTPSVGLGIVRAHNFF